MRNLRGLVLLVGLGMAACEPQTTLNRSGAVSDSAGIRLIQLAQPSGLTPRELAIDEGWGHGKGLDLGRVADLEVLEDGRVAVLDAMGAEVLILDEDFGVTAVLGGPGAGPGEFSPNGLVSVTRTDSSVVVPDLELQRVSEFGFDGGFLGSTSLMDEGAPGAPVFAVEWRSHPTGSTAYRQMMSDGDRVVLRRGGEGVALLSVEISGRAPNLLLSPVLVWDVDPEGRIVWGRSDRHEIRLQDPSEPEPRWIARWEAPEAELTAEDEAHLTTLLV